ncbi:MFS transporter [Mammaliicoccus sciuri]|uniref:MFS transporter n=1 Tax=Mammaliicoccus sciuri TaxID=1296 RepID=UPI002DBBB510|nr:MFS transporter [Mammaliicoccus sciuri]MEB7783758.1 MFS transporter [Mammaliicoccus sciuri]
MNNKIWSKDFVIYSIINFFLILVYFLLNSTITNYAQTEYNSSMIMMGFISSIFIVGALIGRILTGFMKITKKIFILNMMIYFLSITLYFVKLDEYFLIFVRLINGLSTGITTTIVGTIVALIIPQSRKGEGISYFALSTTLATGFGPFIGISLTQDSNLINIFYISLIFSILGLSMTFFIKVPYNEDKKEISIKTLVNKSTIPIGIIIFLSAFSFSGIVTYINLYAIQINLVIAASFFFIIYTASVLVSRPFTGKIADIYGANKIMYPALIFFFVGLFLLSISSDDWMMLLSGLFIGLGFGNISSITQTIAVSEAKPENIGLATSTFMIFMDLGNGLGPYILGFGIPVLGYAGMYKILAIIILLTFILYYLLYAKKTKTTR